MRNNRKAIIAELRSIEATHLKLMLKRKGWDSDVVNNSIDLLNKVASGNYELVLLSNNLLDEPAEEIAQEIRNIEKDNNIRIPIIAITSYSIEAEKRKLIKAGADYCLTKPVYNQNLSDVIIGLTEQDNYSLA
ncbi:response regulator [Chondrinema litorale]|uniref:response regulator n=1 Tax=Chondrinema litorale TaxID=2994555 RepID=UPI0025426F9F|nr:response regulator [Chondrinema litorale]UZR95764.1 response regulator [Chondrinema litorale]